MHLSATSKEIGKLALLFHCLLIHDSFKITAPVGKHQKESVSGHLRFSKINVFRVKIFDSSHGFSANQKHAKIQILTQATPTFNNGINGLYHPVPQKYVCRDLVAEFFP